MRRVSLARRGKSFHDPPGLAETGRKLHGAQALPKNNRHVDDAAFPEESSLFIDEELRLQGRGLEIDHGGWAEEQIEAANSYEIPGMWPEDLARSPGE